MNQTCNTTSSDGPFGPPVCQADGSLFLVFFVHRPSEIAGYVFMALFGLATLGHFIYLCKLRAWFFIPFILGGICETFGYYGRALAHDRPSDVGPWIQQNLLLLTGAPFLAATVYMSSGRIIMSLGARRHAAMSPRWLTRIYVLFDVAVIASQLAGTVMPASGDPHLIELSQQIVLGGLIVQVVALAVFLLIVWGVDRKLEREPTPVIDLAPLIRWHLHIKATELALGLLIVRSIVRMAEFAQGDHGFVASHEVFIYLFDGTLMFLIMVMYLILHPGRLVRDMRAVSKMVDGDGMPMVRVPGFE